MSFNFIKYFRIPLVQFSHLADETLINRFSIHNYKVQCSNRYTSSLTQNRVLEFIASLNNTERRILIDAVKKIDSQDTKLELTGPTAAYRWRSEFGRPSKIIKIDTDGESTEKNDESIVKPTRHQFISIALYNAVPFIGFGFLDNTIMILGGDSIEFMLGSVITISTMTAAALGNTLSDVLSIGSTLYVEKLVAKCGLKKPDLTYNQLNLDSSRFAANVGRTLGVTVGCFLGMFPLLFK